MSSINNTIINTYRNNNTLDSTSWLLQLSLWPLRIVCPLLIIFCPIANWICIHIFQSRIYNRSSSKWYFIFIAIFDTIYVLVTAPLIFLITLEIYILNWNILLCKFIVFLNYLSCQISAGLLACLSIDRLVATSCLLLYRYHCTTNISKYVCSFVILILSIINSHYLIGYTIDLDGYCSIRYYKWYENIYSYLNIVYLLSYSIMPFTIISICNLFIVINVCRNKSHMKKKNLLKKSILTTSNQNGEGIINAPHCCFSTTFDKNEVPINNNNNNTFQLQRYSNESKHDMFVPVHENQIINKTIDSISEWQLQRQNRLSEKLLLDVEQPINPIQPSSIKNNSLSSPRDRLLSSQQLSSSSTYSQKMCVQLQITISLIAISISFIFCTLPNCISTIMIQTHNHNEQVRKFWQAMNYLSIVPHFLGIC
ncbi:unnamed protein product [Rotaria sordida]|uniref:G-protein coupled receptors family 1 profile domain-containing protein n=1 Tax=Rotaria sordida TaxID=392033 RepID=A0A814JPZ0_9BILA|nr:unnamed protein product [Rotaria sordida]